MMVLLTKPNAVVLSTLMVVGVWEYPISLSVVCIGKSPFALRKVVPISASVAEDMTLFIRWHRVWMDPLLVGGVGSLSPFLTSWLARENGLRLCYVRVLHRDRTDSWRRGGSCR